MRLEDWIANLERLVREELVETVRPEVDAAVRETPGASVSTFDAAEPVIAAIAALKVGRVRVPIVLACRRFESAAIASSRLGALVYRL